MCERECVKRGEKRERKGYHGKRKEKENECKQRGGEKMSGEEVMREEG